MTSLRSALRGLQKGSCNNEQAFPGDNCAKCTSGTEVGFTQIEERIGRRNCRRLAGLLCGREGTTSARTNRPKLRHHHDIDVCVEFAKDQSTDAVMTESYYTDIY